MKDSIASVFSLFTSSSTLFCCALPAIFVMMGAGASFASLVNVFPFLITLSVYKIELTLFAFSMMGVAGYLNYRASFLRVRLTRNKVENVCYLESGLGLFFMFLVVYLLLQLFLHT